MKLKNNKGIGLTDAIIAISIFVIFSGIAISISYNIYLQSHFIKRNDTATDYIVEVFEYAKSQSFSSVTTNSLITYITEEMNSNITAVNSVPDLNAIGPGYTFEINVFSLGLYEGYVKQIDATVYYKLGDKIKSVNMSTLINDNLSNT